MKRTCFLSHEDLLSWLARLAEKATVWVPDPDPAHPQVVSYKPFTPGSRPDFRRLPSLSAKGVLYPQGEVLLRFQKDKDPSAPSGYRLSFEDVLPVDCAVLFGCPPCDARGFLVFDEAFLQGPYADPYYRERRKRAVVVSRVCRTWDGACFCHAVGSHPADEEGSDVQMIPVTEGYIFRAVTAKGERFLEGVGVQPTLAQHEEAKAALEQGRAQKPEDAAVVSPSEDFRKRFSDAAFWRLWTERCLSCGLCTFVCPTCYCFTITDESDGIRGERLRSWDACMFHHFTQEASGHNPRPSKAERYRNRVGHKFSYFPEKHGRIACCGCGRCIRSCPVSVDIRTIVRALSQTEDAHV